MIEEELVGALYVPGLTETSIMSRKVTLCLKGGTTNNEKNTIFCTIFSYRFFMNHNTPAVRNASNATFLKVVLVFSQSYIF